MSQPPPRDEPMLQAGLAAHFRSASPGGECPDAETLAVYAEGAAPTDERTRIEAHLASCLRCQSHMIALVGSAPPDASAPAPGAIRGFRGFSLPWRWLVPIGSVAVLALALWLNRATPPAPSEMAFVPRAAEAPIAAAPPEPTTNAPPPQATTAPPQDRAPLVARENPERPAAGPRREADRFARAAPAAPVNEGSRPPEMELAERSKPEQARPASPSPDRAQAAPAAPPPVGAATATDAKAAAAAGAVAESRAVAPSANWRLVDGGVERSAGSGTGTSATRFRPDGVTFRAIAGVPPAIWWAVGDEGAVFRTIDGVTWTRVAFPERVNLASVQATDAHRARVADANQRTFVTDDGGWTWRALP